MAMLRRTLSDPPHPPAEPTLIGNNDRPVVKKLWRRKLRSGAEVEATLWWDNSISEAVVEISVHASFAEDSLAEGIAAGVLAAIEADHGTRPFDAVVDPKEWEAEK
jgi:hypothetical protein